MRCVSPAFDALPFFGRHDARQKIGRDDPLGRLLVAVDRERDALLQEGLLAGLLAADQFFMRQSRESAVQGRAMPADVAMRGEHLVIGRAQLIVRIRRIPAKPHGRHGQQHPIGRPHVFGMRERFMLHERNVRGMDGGSSSRDQHFRQKGRRMRGAHAPSSSRPCTKAGGYSAKGLRVIEKNSPDLIEHIQTGT